MSFDVLPYESLKQYHVKRLVVVVEQDQRIETERRLVSGTDLHLSSCSKLSQDLLGQNSLHKLWVCNKCGKMAASVGINTCPSCTGPSRLKHSEQKSLSCPECARCFTARSSLARHLRVHADERPFQCLECKKRFRTQANLLSHLRVHTGEKPFECKFCEKRFTQQASLKKHARSHTGEKPFRCATCSRMFARNDTFKKHVRTHEKTRRFPCPACSKTFSRSDNLAVHIRRHEKTLATLKDQPVI